MKQAPLHHLRCKELVFVEEGGCLKGTEKGQQIIQPVKAANDFGRECS